MVVSDGKLQGYLAVYDRVDIRCQGQGMIIWGPSFCRHRHHHRCRYPDEN